MCILILARKKRRIWCGNKNERKC